MAHWLFLPDDAIDDLTILATLNATQLEALRAFFDNVELAPRYSLYTKVSELLSVSDETAAELCGFINHIQTQRSRLNREASSIPGELERFLNLAGKKPANQEQAKRISDFVQKFKKQIINLFSDQPKRDHLDKLRGLETGPLPHLHAFRTICDLRPVYDSDASKIVSYLPVITLSMVIHSGVADTYQEVAVLITEPELTEIRETVARADKKLALLKKQHLSLSEAPKGEG